MAWNDWVIPLSDKRDRWTGEDKEAHVGWAAFAVAAFGWPTAIVAAFAVEGVQVFLWRRLPLGQRTAILAGAAKWPTFHDRISLKDLVADAVGIIIGLLGVGIAERIPVILSFLGLLS